MTDKSNDDNVMDLWEQLLILEDEIKQRSEAIHKVKQRIDELNAETKRRKNAPAEESANDGQ
jgi:hypothetical protein